MTFKEEFDDRVVRKLEACALWLEMIADGDLGPTGEFPNG